MPCSGDLRRRNGTIGSRVLSRKELVALPSDTSAVRILVIDEQEVVRRGVLRLLESEAGITVVGEAASVAEALARGLAVRPDVAVVGMRLPDGSGAEVCAGLRARIPGLRCLVLSRYADRDTVTAAVRAGASGYLLKHVRGPALVAAVRRVAAGDIVFDGEAMAAIDRRGPSTQRDRLERLSPQERRVLQLIGEGLTNRQIGEWLGLAEKTVKNYTTRLLSKLGLQRRTQAAILATRLRDRQLSSESAWKCSGYGP
jgi:two-component system response regulator DevR